MKPTGGISLVLMLTLALALSACGAAAAPGVDPEDPAAASADTTRAAATGERVLRVGLPFISQPPDPVRGGFQSVQTGLAETLFKLDENLKPSPWLATGSMQLDERTWEITVRQGVKFHNGDTLNAAAVKASLERAIDKSPRAKVLLDIAEIQVTEPFTLIIATNEPSPILPALLTELTSGIVNAAAAEVMGDAFSERPVLTGPYKVERFQIDRELLVVPHQDYWGSPPRLDRVIFTYLPDNQSRVLALQSGDIDIAVNIAAESVATLVADENLSVKTAPPIYLEFMYLNHQQEGWQDVRVRKAIALAIDREGLLNAVVQGQGLPATGPFPPAMLDCNDLQGYPLDKARAIELLAQAGYRDINGDGFVERDGQPLTMTLLTYRQRPELPPMAEAIQGYLMQVGIRVNVRMVDQVDAVLRQGDWDAAMYFVTMGLSGDPYLNLSQYFSSGGSANFGGYSSPQVDDLTIRLSAAAAPQQRTQLACAASQTIIDDVAVVPLVYPNHLFGVSTRVIGFDAPHPFAWYFMDNKIGLR
jgi:peptide/nickel transport system substrate-binding protein